MLKKVYIASLVLLIGLGNILIMQSLPKEAQFSQKSILGVFDISKIVNQTKPIKQTNSENISVKDKFASQMSQTKQVLEIEIRLEGNGCTKNKAPNICKIVSNQKPGVILKQCDENNWDKCNFYLYQLGKRDGDIQYVLQAYTENSDRLLDILEYNVKTNIVGNLKTVLYQEGMSAADDKNIEYTDTMDQFKAI